MVRSIVSGATHPSVMALFVLFAGPSISKKNCMKYMFSVCPNWSKGKHKPIEK